MSKSFLTIVFILSISVLTAQNPLIITKQNFVISPDNDTVYSVVKSTLSGITVPKTGANQLWDYSNLTKEDIYYIDPYLPPDKPGFTDAFCASDKNFEVIAVSRGYFYKEYMYLDDNGYYAKGITLDNQSYFIGDLTMNQNDSMVAPEQSWTYPSVRWAYKFPLTYGDVTVSNFMRATNYTLTLTAFGLSKVPSLKKAYITQNDSILGWGRVVLPGTTGKTSPIEVLLIKRIVTEIDSFFIGGVPAQKMLLDNFALSQGQKISSYSYYFTRENHKSAILTFGFSDPVFTRISGIIWDMSADLLTDVRDNPLKNSVDISISPNPVTDNLNIKGDNIKLIQIYSVVGVKVLESVFAENIPVAELSAGMYYCKITTGNNIITKKFVVVR